MDVWVDRCVDHSKDCLQQSKRALRKYVYKKSLTYLCIDKIMLDPTRHVSTNPIPQYECVMGSFKNGVSKVLIQLTVKERQVNDQPNQLKNLR